MSWLARFLSQALASCFFVTYPLVRWTKSHGMRRTGSGLIGTVAGVLSVGILPRDPVRCGLVLTAAVLFAVAISDHAEEILGQKDDQRIVIDEWVGYLASVAFLPHQPLLLVAAFVLFRIMDVWKPLGIRRLGDLPGGWGVVADDLAAGGIVNLLLQIWMH